MTPILSKQWDGKKRFLREQAILTLTGPVARAAKDSDGQALF